LPWDNETWRGKKIGVIRVPADAAKEVTQFTIDVASSVEGLGGKHALFLVADGPASQALCDIVGLGFSSAEKKIVRPVPPKVSIQVNGKEIELPATPVRSTPANGITGYGQYEAEYSLPASDEGAPQVTASTSDPSVKVDITQADSRDGAAVVKFDNNGVVKTYRVSFTSR
jgi:arabinoxylan arabinofuranohydrolase